MTDTIKPQKIYAIFGKYGPHTNMRKFSLEPFVGACEYVLSSTPESREKALDELVNHDQENGLYDTPKWGEPFYGSYEIISYLHFANEAYAWINAIADWSSRNTFSAYCPTKIYRFKANHPFYKTDLFKNAKKPDANHPCRGDE